MLLQTVMQADVVIIQITELDVETCTIIIPPLLRAYADACLMRGKSILERITKAIIQLVICALGDVIVVSKFI